MKSRNRTNSCRNKKSDFAFNRGSAECLQRYVIIPVRTCHCTPNEVFGLFPECCSIICLMKEVL